MTIAFTIVRTDRTYQARANGGTPFFVGLSTHYTDKKTGESFQGLYNVPARALPKLVYDGAANRQTFGFWADFIGPTSRCEGGNYLTLNTYDRAKFTFGFGQFGAHVPGGDFILYFRDMLARPEAPDYFPNLEVKNGVIVEVTPSGEVPLESATSTKALMDYLNPTTAHIEDDEVIAAAKLIHWTTNNKAAQDLQVFHMIGAFKRLMSSAGRNLNLDGLTADLCLVVCDILHQGRAKYQAMRQALASSNPRNGLLALGSIAYPDRIRTLRAAIKDIEPILMARHWNKAKQDFV